MPAVVHLVKGAVGDLAAETIRQQVAAGDRVTVVLLDAAAAPALGGSPNVSVRRVHDDLDWSALLDLVFSADQVVAW